MRIRKNASKLLGSAIVYSSAPFPPPSDTWDPPSSSNPSICASSGELCELNQSPWDVYPNLHFFTSSCFEDVESPPTLKEAQEEVIPDAISENDKGILGKSPEKEIIESETKPLRVCKRVDVKKSKEKKTTTKKKKKNNKTAVMLCKKNDGKKWFCKRPAQLPHSFCEYHLSQSRSYYSSHKEKEASELEPWCRSSKKKDNNGGTSTNPYYYYNGFWPSGRKRRAATSAHDGGDAMHVDDDKKFDGHGVSMTAGAGEDHVVDDSIISDMSDGKEKRVCKKRRRKPTKCRSLKSLL